MFSERALHIQSDAQKLLFSGCRELNFSKVFSAIEMGADVNLKAAIQTDKDRPVEQGSYDIAIFQSEGCSFSPLSLVALHGNRRVENAIGSDEKACAIAELLLENGAELDTLDTGDMGNTPLHWALVTYKNNLSKLFIEHAMAYQKNIINMPNQPAKPHYGSNPPLVMALKAASQYLSFNTCNLELAELLVAAGADVNKTDHQQQNALHWAAILRCRKEFFHVLIENGALYQKDLFGKTPKYLYETPIKSNMININRSSGSFTELGFHLVNWDKEPSLLELDRKRALNRRNAVYEQEILDLLEMFEMSLHESNEAIDGATINHQDDWGRTRLHRAVFYVKQEEFEKLLKAGADLNIKDNLGLTALELAQYLQKRFTHTVSPEFFDGEKKSIKAGNCAIWSEFAEKLSAINKDELNIQLPKIAF